MHSNLPLQTPTVNKSEESSLVTEASTSETTSQVLIPVPSALITAKPVANVEQQRAIITRVNRRKKTIINTIFFYSGYDSSRFRKIS